MGYARQRRAVSIFDTAWPLREIIVSQEDIDKILREDVLKRETIEGDLATQATRRVNRSSEKSILKSGEREQETVVSAVPAAPTTAPK